MKVEAKEKNTMRIENGNIIEVRGCTYGVIGRDNDSVDLHCLGTANFTGVSIKRLIKDGARVIKTESVEDNYLIRMVGDYKVSIFRTTHGTELYISDSENNKLYGRKCTQKNPIAFARQIIESWQ